MSVILTSAKLTSVKLTSVKPTSAMSNTTQRLEEIVACLKDDSLELDQALSLLEEAQKLADKACDEFEEQFRAPAALDGVGGEHAGAAPTEVSADERFDANDHAGKRTVESANEHGAAHSEVPTPEHAGERTEATVNDHAGKRTNEHSPKEVS